MNTPILFLIFNRPDVTLRVFNAIREAQPLKLFVAADGPRKHFPSDAIKCQQTREIIKHIDWPCEVQTLFRDENLGCRRAVSGGITWFFEHVEDGIILEDDCLPHPDFFKLSETLLEKYRHNPKVMHISGGNYQFGQWRGEGSYYFSRISHIWGWASWRRAWEHYDVDMRDLPEFLRERHRFFINDELEKYWIFNFKRMYRGSDTWDYQWSYAVMKNNGFCINSNINLISNIGFGDEATHSSSKVSPLANMKTASLPDIIHPSAIKFDDDADIFTVQVAFPMPSLRKMVFMKVKKEIKKLLRL